MSAVVIVGVQPLGERVASYPDSMWQGAGSLREYAPELTGSSGWTFWWD